MACVVSFPRLTPARYVRHPTTAVLILFTVDSNTPIWQLWGTLWITKNAQECSNMT